MARSSGLSGPGLLRIFAGVLSLPTSWSRAANSASRRELQDVAAVGAGVRVLGFDDVAQQERGSPVGARELERLVESTLPLSRREADHEEERERKQESPLVMECGQCRKQPERRQRQVDRKDERELRQHVPRRDAERRPLAHG